MMSAPRELQTSGTPLLWQRTRSWTLRSSVCSERWEPEQPPAVPMRHVRAGDEEGAAEEDGCTKQPWRGGGFAAEASPVMSLRSWQLDSQEDPFMGAAFPEELQKKISKSRQADTYWVCCALLSEALRRSSAPC